MWTTNVLINQFLNVVFSASLLFVGATSISLYDFWFKLFYAAVCKAHVLYSYLLHAFYILHSKIVVSTR